jgi:hypothetical protein
MKVHDCREAPPCVVTEHWQAAFVIALRARNARRSDHSDEDTLTVRRHPAVVDAGCYRVTGARADCVGSARLSGSSSTYWRKVRRSLCPMFSSAAEASNPSRTACASPLE